MSMLSRLLGSLHSAVFDTSPDAGLAFFISHPDGIQWTVVDEMLTATVNGHSKAYDLSVLTMGQLAGQLVIDGFEVSGLSAEFSGLSASTLIDGSGNTLDSNGNRLFGFRDLLRPLFGGYARELRIAKQQATEAINQMVITQAEGEWLDLWGTLYNAPRPSGMTDAKFQKLIPEEAFRIRVNGLAIEKSILDLTGQVVHIEEPWGDMFRLDESKLSSLSRFYDGSTVGYHLIRPVSDKAIDWTGITDIIARNKAAGVIVLPPEERNRTWVKDPLAGKIWQQRIDLWSTWLKGRNVPRLDDNLYLSDYTVEKNYRVAITSLQMISSLSDELNGPQRPSSPSNILGYYAELPHDQVIMPFHTSFYRPQFIQAYGSAKKTWRDAGRWAGRQTWAKPYEWKVLSRITSLASGAIVDASILGSVTVEASTGADWTIPQSWDDMTWEGIDGGQASWETGSRWDDIAW